MSKKLKNYEVLVKALDNFSLVSLDINVLRKGEKVFKKVKESTADGFPPLYLSFIEENSEPFTLETNDSKSWDGILEYSTDTKNWAEWDGAEISSSNDGKLYLRGTGNKKITGDSDKQFLLTDDKRIQCLGNIETLLDYKTVAAGKHPVMTDSCYEEMFSGCTSLTTAPDLPATSLAERCYNSMFYNCASLTQVPEVLPATSLDYNCYENMFNSCTSLTKAPELPATDLANNCYSNMFYNCTSLAQAPELPATDLAKWCYGGMFSGCASLTTAPELPATYLRQNCYTGMFFGCTSLTGTIHCPASTASNSNRLDADAYNIPANTVTVVYDL